MNEVKITVGGEMEQEASRQFIDAWHRAERGETFHERHLAFESWDTLARVLTGKRMELLSYVRRNNVTSVRAAAARLQQRSRGRSGPGQGRLARCDIERRPRGLRRHRDADRDLKRCGLPPIRDGTAEGFGARRSNLGGKEKGPEQG